MRLTAAPSLYTFSLHDALPILDLLDLEVTGLDDGGLRHRCQAGQGRQPQGEGRCGDAEAGGALPDGGTDRACRSEEHTSDLQSRGHLVCRLMLEKKKYNV